VPIGTGQPLPKRHIILPIENSVTPIYLQDPNSPTRHPSRCDKNRAKMLENLTKYLTKGIEKDNTLSRQQPAGWREKDPADHMGTIMNHTIIRVPH